MVESMKSYRNEDLIELLTDGQADLRMLSLHLLCEGYATAPEVFRAIVKAWERWGPTEAFPEFPMLSYLPIPSEAIEESCRLAGQFVAGAALTSPASRCAGKLIEQLVALPAIDLKPHFALLQETTRRSKIFFRVDMQGLQNRISFLDLSEAELSEQLNGAIEELVRDASSAQAVHKALHALEALRNQFPDSLDLSQVLAKGPADQGAQAASFQLTLQSLMQFEQPGLESALSPHLHDTREAVYPNVVEALVRAGTPEAASALVNRFDSAGPENQKWIARGLQRIRGPRLAGRISDLRGRVSVPAIWIMLLIAEVRQFEAHSGERLVSDLERLQSFSETLIDSLTVFTRLNEKAEGAREFQSVVMRYMQRANQSLGKQLTQKKQKLLSKERKMRERRRKQTIVRYRKQK